MLPWLTFALVALGAEAVAVVVVLAVERPRLARARAFAAADLASSTGLDVSAVAPPRNGVEPLGAKLRGTLDGVAVAIDNGARLHPPGITSEEAAPAVCSITVAADLDDALFCKVIEADAIVGPLPTARRVRTGHAAFDAAYAIFLSPSAEPRPTDFRSAPVSRSFATLPVELFDTLLDLGAAWGRSREGQVQIVTAQLCSVDVRRACWLALRVAGRPGPVIPRGRRADPPSDGAGEILLLGGVAVGIFGTTLGLIPGFFAQWLAGSEDESYVLAGVLGSVAVCAAVVLFFAVRRLLRDSGR